MKVTQVSISQTEAAREAGAPVLTPELLAATGARYSRSNEGLDEILSRIDPDNLDRSVDSIFRMLDYGHQSIADMAPVAMFMDGISQWLAYVIWSQCPTAGGQESSTRYIEMTADALIDPELLGIDPSQREAWQGHMHACLNAYETATALWDAAGSADPSLTRIPEALLDDPDPKAQRKVTRMRRNFVFDRARYYIPFALATNVMMIMSARGWAQLCEYLCSYPLPEARALGDAIREQLALCAPRLMKHAVAKASVQHGIADILAGLRGVARGGVPSSLQAGDAATDAAPTAHVDVLPVSGATYAADLAHHDNRYAWMGESLRRTAVRFGWEAVALAELRDLNRHRTGTKHCPMLPVGFYGAQDQFPPEPGAIADLVDAGRTACLAAHEQLAAGNPAYVYWLPLGAQTPFEHTTTADKFIYEAELRTGVGAHYRYALHLHDALIKWYDLYPETRGLILEGTAEPE